MVAGAMLSTEKPRKIKVNWTATGDHLSRPDVTREINYKEVTKTEADAQ